MRLNSYLARAGVASRRKADELIKAGRVMVNGLAGELNSEVLEKDEIKLDGKRVEAQKFRYILLNKPPKTVSTLNDPQNRQKVTDLIDIPERVVPVGRLDYNTTGAMLLTNDGQLTHRLMHPSFEIDKVYEAKVRGTITDEIINRLASGVKLSDGISAPAKVRKLLHNKIELALHEGRQHQVKRMLAAVGLQVIKLHRSRYGTLDLNGLSAGRWRELTASEVSALKQP